MKSYQWIEAKDIWAREFFECSRWFGPFSLGRVQFVINGPWLYFLEMKLGKYFAGLYEGRIRYGVDV